MDAIRTRRRTGHRRGAAQMRTRREAAHLKVAPKLALAILAVVWLQSATAQGGLHINSARLQGTLEKLSEFGRNADGGVTRLGYSETEMAAQKYVMGLMRDAG